MTVAKKTGYTLASLVGAVVLIFGAWPTIEPAANWLINNLGFILAREQVQAVLAASAAGVFLGVPLPHLLPSKWHPATTRLVAGFICALTTFAVALALMPTRTGFVYAFITAVASPTVAQLTAGLFYLIRPAFKPESLQP
jgi:hypothetical protein